MKQAIFGVLWAVALYFAACFLVGAVAGAIAGSNDPQNASAAGARAGYNAVVACRLYLLAGAVAIGALGAWFRFLPGTRRKGAIPSDPSGRSAGDNHPFG